MSSAGADVGFAAILGLAILVLLFFSQARETSTLRRRADEAEEQLRQLSAHVDHLSRTRPAAAPAPATGTIAPVPPPAAARIAARQAAFPAASRSVPAARMGASSSAAGATGAVATIPAAPAGVGAPALSSATRLIPSAQPDPISIRALKNGGADPAPESESTSARAAAAGAGAAAGAAATMAVAAPAGPPPSTAAGGANGSARAATPPPASAGDVVPPPREPQRPETAAPSRPVGPPTFNDPVPPSHTRVSRLALVAASVVAVIVVIVAVLVLVNRGHNGATAQNAASTGTARATSSHAGRRTRHHAATTVTPSAVTVAVLNGTTTSHLAADVMSKLNSAGYKSGATTNAPEQNLTSTIVGYTQPSFRADALAVAKSLNLGPASVQGVSQGDRSAACPGASCPAQVIVTLGADLSSAASTAAPASTT